MRGRNVEEGRLPELIGFQAATPMRERNGLPKPPVCSEVGHSAKKVQEAIRSEEITRHKKKGDREKKGVKSSQSARDLQSCQINEEKAGKDRSQTSMQNLLRSGK